MEGKVPILVEALAGGRRCSCGIRVTMYLISTLMLGTCVEPPRYVLYKYSSLDWDDSRIRSM